MTGLDPSRVAEVKADGLSGSTGVRASGYRITSDVVLTAEHATRNGTGISVRFNADQPDEWSAAASVMWSDTAEDGALLLLQLPAGAVSVAPVAYGRVTSQPGVIDTQAVGFPWWKLRGASAAGPLQASRYRDMHQAVCTISTLSNRRSNTLELSTSSPPGRHSQPGRSPWEGMSGAAVWAGNRIIGLIREHSLAEGPNHLTASRIERLIRKMPPSARQVIGATDPDLLPEVPDISTAPQRQAPTGNMRQDLYSTGRNLLVGGLAWFAGERHARRSGRQVTEAGRGHHMDSPADDPLSNMDSGDGSYTDFLDL
jgi:hypothetical protein